MMVWALTISHRHGENVEVYESHEAARDAVHDHVDTWWFPEMGDTPQPADQAAAIEAYFDKVEDEDYTIVETDLRLPGVMKIIDGMREPLERLRAHTKDRTRSASDNRDEALLLAGMALGVFDRLAALFGPAGGGNGQG